MTMRFTNAINAARSTAIGGTGGLTQTGVTIKIYTTTYPGNADTAVSSQTLLVTLTIAGALGTESNGVLTLGTISSNTAVATGTANWARVASSGGTTLFDFDSIVATGSTGDLVLNSTSIVSGGTVSINTGGTSTEQYP